MSGDTETGRHTPTPWRCVEAADAVIITADTRKYRVPIAEISIGYLAPFETEQHANAAFIARAVNAHDGMVAALKSCQGLLAEIGNAAAFKQLTDEELGRAWGAVFEQADAALAKAKTTP